MTPILTALTFSMGAHQSLFARHFIQADQQARERGVTLAISQDFAALKALNAVNQDSWYPLTTTFDPDLSDTSDGFWAAAVDPSGRVVSTVANRVLDWRGSDFQSELVSLRLFYRAPETHAGQREAFALSLAAQQVTLSGMSCYSGAGWTHPDARGRDLPKLLIGVSRAVAVAQGADWCFGLSAAHPTKPGVYYDYGYRHTVAPLYLVGANITTAPLKEMALSYSSRAEVIASMDAERSHGGQVRAA